jgi:hypothetical protein
MRDGSGNGYPLRDDYGLTLYQSDRPSKIARSLHRFGSERERRSGRNRRGHPQRSASKAKVTKHS